MANDQSRQEFGGGRRWVMMIRPSYEEGASALGAIRQGVCFEDRNYTAISRFTHFDEVVSHGSSVPDSAVSKTDDDIRYGSRAKTLCRASLGNEGSTPARSELCSWPTMSLAQSGDEF